MAKLLIVDDSALSRRIMRGILETGGHDVIEAADGMAALELYFLHKPQAVLLDLTMKGMSGFDVIAKLRELDEKARIVVASADIQTSTRSLTEAAGAVGFVTKPFSGEQILAAVNAALKDG